MLAKRILPRGGLLVCLMLPVGLFSQTSPPRKDRSAPTGLKILSTTLGDPIASNPNLRPVTVTVQNVTNKTVVAHAFVIHEFDANGQEINPNGAGVVMDYAGPDSMNHPEKFILPGQVRSIPVLSVGPKTVRVSVTLTGLAYEDRSSEGGSIAGIIFNARANNARNAREAAAKEPPGEKKAALERQAEWYETHGPLEAQQ